MEQLKKIQEYLELVFDKVTIVNSELANILIIVEQNGHKKQMEFPKALYLPLLAKYNDTHCKSFAKNISVDFITYLIDNGIHT